MPQRSPASTPFLLALPIAYALTLAGCGKEEAPPVPTAPPAAAAPSAPATSQEAFPMGNAVREAALAECKKLPDPPRLDDTPTGRSTAVSRGQHARADCAREVERRLDQPNADLARIREIKEREQADFTQAQKSDREFFKNQYEGAKRPLIQFKH